MARSQRSKIRQRRRAPLRAKYEERLKQALIVKHKLMAIEKANKSKVMEVSEATHVSQPDRGSGETNSNSNLNKSSDTVTDKESQRKPLSKSKLKKQKESRKRKRLGVRKGQWKWS